MTDVDFFNLFAVQKRGAPEGWEWRKLEAIGDLHAKDDAQKYTKMEGYVHNGATFKTGKKAGQKKPRSPVPGTEREIVFTMADIETLKTEWEASTGKCHQCTGSGREWTGWSADAGNRFKSCTRCNATGATS